MPSTLPVGKSCRFPYNGIEMKNDAQLLNYLEARRTFPFWVKGYDASRWFQIGAGAETDKHAVLLAKAIDYSYPTVSHIVVDRRVPEFVVYGCLVEVKLYRHEVLQYKLHLATNIFAARVLQYWTAQSRYNTGKMKDLFPRFNELRLERHNNGKAH